MLADADFAVRPAPHVWSRLEYACHVRDVHELFAERVRLMLDEDDPTFDNWDQDATAAGAGLRPRRTPATVGTDLVERAARSPRSTRAVDRDQWQRAGRRSNGSLFTVETLGRYHLHDVVHHLWDVSRSAEPSAVPGGTREAHRVLGRGWSPRSVRRTPARGPSSTCSASSAGARWSRHSRRGAAQGGLARRVGRAGAARAGALTFAHSSPKRDVARGAAASPDRTSLPGFDSENDPREHPQCTSLHALVTARRRRPRRRGLRPRHARRLAGTSPADAARTPRHQPGTITTAR